MHPYKLVKDVRSGYETSDVEGVMNGNLTPFLKAYLMNEGQGSADEMDDLQKTSNQFEIIFLNLIKDLQWTRIYKYKIKIRVNSMVIND